MRTLCPNLDREDGLDTVLEVPIPEEMYGSSKQNRSWQNMKSWIRSQPERSVVGGRNAEIQLLLGVVGAPLIPLPIRCNQPITRNIKDHPIEASMAKYIVKQYIAATGGEKALNGIDSMYAMGKVKMVASELEGGERKAISKVMKSGRHGGAGEMGGFVLWQKRSELWCLELVVSGCKISAGSDGKVAWRQTPWHHSHASRGPPRPLRRFLQGLDPKSTASLFSKSVCVGEKSISEEDCFVLKLEAEASALRARCSSNVEIVRHTVWGYFSQRTALLLKLQDSHLLRIKANSSSGHDTVFWETTMESVVQDYRSVDGINIAHAGTTCVSLFRFGEGSESTQSSSRTRMEESWTIEEVDFNIKGLSMDCFLPPADLMMIKKEDQEEGCGTANNPLFPFKIRSPSAWVGSVSKVVAIDDGEEEV